MAKDATELRRIIDTDYLSAKNYTDTREMHTMTYLSAYTTGYLEGHKDGKIDSEETSWIKCSDSMPYQHRIKDNPRLMVSDYVLVRISKDFVTTDRLFNGSWEINTDTPILEWTAIPK